MRVRAHFYAQLRDVTGVETFETELAEPATASDLLGKIFTAFPRLRDHDKTILMGAGIEFVDREYKLSHNEEIAIMPPVQGG